MVDYHLLTYFRNFKESWPKVIHNQTVTDWYTGTPSMNLKDSEPNRYFTVLSKERRIPTVFLKSRLCSCLAYVTPWLDINHKLFIIPWRWNGGGTGPDVDRGYHRNTFTSLSRPNNSTLDRERLCLLNHSPCERDGGRS